MASVDPTRRRRVVLHVGAPKTGTTYLQQRLELNAAHLARHGVHYPVHRQRLRWRASLQFRAALDLLGEDWGGPPGHARGAWAELVRQVRRRRGSVVIGHELLAGADEPVVESMLRDLATDEVHVVYTVRDLGRMLPAAWQESLKQGRTMKFGRFLEQARHDRLWFMRTFDVPRVLGPWLARLPPEQVHVVVVPRDGASREVLWERFCTAAAIDPGLAPRLPVGSNPSLGIPEAQLLRMVNRRLGGTAHRDHRTHQMLGEIVAEGVLAERASSRPEISPDAYEWVAARSRGWTEWIEESGVDVVGDLDELRPSAPDPETWQDPDQLQARRVASAAVDALLALTDEASSRQVPLRRRTAQRWEEVTGRRTASGARALDELHG